MIGTLATGLAADPATLRRGLHAQGRARQVTGQLSQGNDSWEPARSRSHRSGLRGLCRDKGVEGLGDSGDSCLGSHASLAELMSPVPSVTEA